MKTFVTLTLTKTTKNCAVYQDPSQTQIKGPLYLVTESVLGGKTPEKVVITIETED